MPKPKKTGHKSHDRVMEQDWKAKQGHNSGMINPELQKVYAEDDKLAEQIKSLNKERRALRLRARDEFGIPIRAYNIVNSWRKMDKNVAAELEQIVYDTKVMIGYQLALNLVGGEAKSDTQEDPIEAARRKVTSIKKKPGFVKGQPLPEDEEEIA